MLSSATAIFLIYAAAVTQHWNDASLNTCKYTCYIDGTVLRHTETDANDELEVRDMHYIYSQKNSTKRVTKTYQSTAKMWV